VGHTYDYNSTSVPPFSRVVAPVVKHEIGMWQKCSAEALLRCGRLTWLQWEDCGTVFRRRGNVKYGDTGVRRRSTECTRRQITRTLVSTYVLRPRELLVQYFGGPEYKSGGQGDRRTGGVPDVQVDKEFNRT
jgi:hypothetical protein